MLIVICIGALVGLLAGELVSPGPHRLGLAVAATLAAVGAIAARKRATWRVIALACCAAAMGALRVELHKPLERDPLAAFANTPARITGRLATAPVRTERALRFVVDVATVGGATVHEARVLVVADPEDPAVADLGLGDTVDVRGRLGSPDGPSATPPIGGGSVIRTMLFPKLTRLESASTEPLALAARLRTSAISAIQHALPEPQASLAAGVLLGGSGRLGPEFKQQLERSGLAHIVAIDGYKQVLVSTVLGALAVRLVGRPWAAAPILLGVLGYTLLTGARPSAVRAGLMVGAASLAGLVGRVPDSLTSLLLAATLMVAWEPSVLLDVGFQLSATATLGLILLWPQVRRAFNGVPHLIAEPAGVTLAVTLATLPVMLSVFQSVSLISPLAHVIGMPLLPPVLLAALLLAVSGPVPWLQQAVAWLAWLPTTLLAETVRMSGSVPAAALSTGRLPLGAAVVLGALLLGWGIWNLPDVADVRQRLDRARLRTIGPSLPGPALVVACSTIVLSTLLVVRPDGRTHVDVLSVLPGQAVLIRGPTGRTALVARGKLDSRALTSAVAERLVLWQHGLYAAVALDELAEQQLAQVLERYPAGERVTAGQDARVDLGAGAVLDVYARVPLQPAAALSFGHAWVRVLGDPPAPLGAPDGGPPITTLRADADLVL
ncbi:MAG TPA: ComEC/Rec2 family competence protein [Chloroflexota bacterium]